MPDSKDLEESDRVRASVSEWLPVSAGIDTDRNVGQDPGEILAEMKERGESLNKRRAHRHLLSMVWHIRSNSS